MSTYRSPPASRAPTVVVMKQSPYVYLIWLGLFGFLSIFVVFLCSRVTLTCARSEGSCSVIVQRGPGIVFEHETFALASIERASVESHVDEEGDTLEGIALVRNGKPELLNGSSTAGHDGKLEWAATVNAFLTDPSRDRLEISRGAIWPAYAWCLLGLAWLAGILRTRTRFIIDKDAGVLRFERRGLFVSWQEFPIAEIAAAEIRMQTSGDATNRVIHLVLKNGTAKALKSFSTSSDKEQTRVVEAVNAALRREE